MNRVLARLALCGLAVACAATAAISASAEQKVFSGAGDGVSWDDPTNWFSNGVPAITDGVAINKDSIEAVASEDFLAQSITIGGSAVSSLTVEPMIYGTVTPTTTSDTAVYIRKDGTVVLSGAGVIVMRGSFKNSEEEIATESSTIILLE